MIDDLNDKQIIDKIQEVALHLSTEDNELLKPHLLPFLDKALKTDNKQVIKAINEIKKRLDMNDASLKNFMDQLLPVIGDWMDNPDLLDDLHKVAPTILEALTKSKESTSKAISFQFFKRPTNTERLIIKSPYEGEIESVSAYVSVVGTEDTDLTIEKISESDFINGIDAWNSVLSSNLVIKAGEYVDDKTVLLSEKTVNKYDIFRVKMINSGNIEGLNVQIVYHI